MKQVTKLLVVGITSVFLTTAFFDYNSTLYAATEYSTDVIAKVQELLTEKGYDCGTADGVIGSKTQAAIEQYQTDNGLEVTGVIDEQLLESLSEDADSASLSDDSEEAYIPLAFQDIVTRVSDAAADESIEFSDVVIYNKAYGCVVTYANRSTFIVVCNPINNEKSSIGIVQQSVSEEYGAQDTTEIWTSFVKAVDASLSASDAYECVIDTVQNGECEINDVTYEYMELYGDSLSFYIHYDNSNVYERFYFRLVNTVDSDEFQISDYRIMENDEVTAIVYDFAYYGISCYVLFTPEDDGTTSVGLVTYDIDDDTYSYYADLMVYFVQTIDDTLTDNEAKNILANILEDGSYKYNGIDYYYYQTSIYAIINLS